MKIRLGLAIACACLPVSARASPGPAISDAALQKIGCITTDGRAVNTGCKLAAAIDLTKPFHTPVPWIFLITQGPDNTGTAAPGDLNFCFLKNWIPQCDHQNFAHYPGLVSNPPFPGFALAALDSATIIPPSKNAPDPVLMVRAQYFADGAPGSSTIFTLIWAYHAAAKTFAQIWFNASYPGRNEETRLIQSGPLAGDVIVATDDPSGKYPWPYGIEVYKLTPSGHYTETLHFLGKSAQAGGPPGPVIDADMPQILRALHAN